MPGSMLGRAAVEIKVQLLGHAEYSKRIASVPRVWRLPLKNASKIVGLRCLQELRWKSISSRPRPSFPRLVPLTSA